MAAAVVASPSNALTFFAEQHVVFSPKFNVSQDIMPGASCIVCLKGTCSAGKTTLGKTLASSSSNWVYLDDDSISATIYLEEARNLCPREYATALVAISIDNLFYALYNQDILFKDSATTEEQAQAKAALKQMQEQFANPKNKLWKDAKHRRVYVAILSAIKDAVIQKKKVLLDSWWLTADEIQRIFSKVQVFRLMLYSPLSIATERFKLRNLACTTSSKIAEKRYVKNLVESFCGLYKAAKKPDLAIEKIDSVVTRQQFEALTVAAKQDNQDVPKQYCPNLQDLFKQFMHPFEDARESSLYITPMAHQDIVIKNAPSANEAVAYIRSLFG